VGVATTNVDDFEKNMITIRAEERGALAVTRPESFVYGAFGTAVLPEDDPIPERGNMGWTRVSEGRGSFPSTRRKP
jgi:hypothetical protein